MQCISRPGLVLALAVAFILPAGCYDEYVSPGDYMGQVSAWYFGHAT
jgi:hypothetical protein